MTAKNFKGNLLDLSDEAFDGDGDGDGDGDSPALMYIHTTPGLFNPGRARAGCEACYSHLITSICVTSGISIEQGQVCSFWPSRPRFRAGPSLTGNVV